MAAPRALANMVGLDFLVGKPCLLINSPCRNWLVCMASSAAKEQSLISSERTGEIRGDTDVLRRSDCLSHIVYAKVLESDGKVPNSGFLAIDMGYG